MLSLGPVILTEQRAALDDSASGSVEGSDVKVEVSLPVFVLGTWALL